MIEPKLQARARRRQQPLPRLSCEHVIAGTLTAARIIRDGVLLSVCNQCWTKDEQRLSYDGQPRTVIERAAEQWMQNQLIDDEDQQ